MPERWATAIFTAWALIATLGLLRVGAGLWQVRRLRRTCTEIPLEALPREAAEAIRSGVGGRRVKLCTSTQVRVPTAIGFRNPAVVIPAWLLAELPAGELRQVILHERAHLDRHDDWTNLAQKLVRALLFFHPAVWWIEARLSLEREMACDDAVLARTARPEQYAECLARLAEKSFGRRGAQLAQALASRVRQTSLRVAQILDARRPQPGRAWTLAGILLVLAAGITAISAERAQQWIAFSGDAPLAVTSSASVAGRSNVLVPAAYLRPAKFVTLPQPPARSLPAAKRPAVTPFRSAPSKDALQLVQNVRARRVAGELPSLVLTLFTEESTPQGVVVQMWRFTVWVPADPQAAKQVPQKST